MAPADYYQLLSTAGSFDLMADCFERRAVNRNLLRTSAEVLFRHPGDTTRRLLPKIEKLRRRLDTWKELEERAVINRVGQEFLNFVSGSADISDFI